MTEQDSLHDIEIKVSAPTTISSATTTNFDITFDKQDFVSAKAYLNLVSKASGTSAAISALKLASDTGFSADVTTYNSENEANIIANDTSSSVGAFAQTALTAAGIRPISFGNLAVKTVQDNARITVTTVGGSVSLVAQIIWVIKRTKAPIVQA